MNINFTKIFLLTLCFATTDVRGAEFSKPIKVSDTLQESGGVRDPAIISPDAKHLIYVADQDSNGVNELYRVPLLGGISTKLSQQLADGGEVSEDFLISPDSRYVIYRASIRGGASMELFSVPIFGGSQVKLNDTLDTGFFQQVPNGFLITPDSQRVIYAADQIDDGTQFRQLYSTSITGGQAIRLGDESVSFSPPSYEISKDGENVVYRGIDISTQLYVAPVGGGNSLKLNADLQSGGNVIDFIISNNNEFVIYRADQYVDNKTELYYVPIGGGDIKALNSVVANNRDVTEMQISPDSNYVVYRIDQNTHNLDELYSVDLNQSVPKPVRILDSIIADGDVTKFKISSDSAKVIYLADKEIDNKFWLYTVPIRTGVNTKLNLGTTSNSDVRTFQLSANGVHVVFETTRDIYSVPIEAGVPKKLNFNLIGDTSIEDFQISPDSQRVIYTADKDDNRDPEIYSVLITGGNSQSLIGEEPVEGVFNEYFWISDNSEHVVYLSNLFDQSKDELYVVSLLDELCVPIVAKNEEIAVICL